jgi:Putative prokaryotic signal transducing protein
MAPIDPLEPVVLTAAPHEWGAGVIVAALEQEEIKATMAGENTADFRVATPGWVQVYVAKKDLERAREILEKVQAENSHIDWSQVDVGEPEAE